MRNMITILTEARALITDKARWTRHAHARDANEVSVRATDPSACTWCADGALMKVTQYDCRRDDASFDDREAYLSAEAILMQASKALFPSYESFVDVNDFDQQDQAHEHILAVFDGAIKIAATDGSAA